MKPENTRPIAFHQLCAIARLVLEADPSMPDAEWKERTKVTLSKQGYEHRDPDMLARALTQVENATRKTLGPRSVPLAEAHPEATPPRQDDPPWRGRTPPGWTLVATLLARLSTTGNASGASSTPPLAAAPDPLAITEAMVLDEFWGAVRHVDAATAVHPQRGVDRLVLLRVFAEIAIVRDAEWDVAAIRAHAHDPRLRADRCFVCYAPARAVDWHHLIQVQHGGSNTARNRIALCAPCHASVHPWLPAVPRTGEGSWSSPVDVMRRYGLLIGPRAQDGVREDLDQVARCEEVER